MIDIKIQNLLKLKLKLIELREDEDTLINAFHHNPWFIVRHTRQAIDSICDNFLDEVKLRSWVLKYDIKPQQKNIGIIAAGNVPLVSFHDILCSYVVGFDKYKIKLSSKDSILTKLILKYLSEIDSDFDKKTEVVDFIKDCDKIIATGSNNSNTYFEYYFKKYDTLLRRNRTSIAVIHKEITDEEIKLLNRDILSYFGLGCRNVSKVFVENGFEISRILDNLEEFRYLVDSQKYMNNYDYNRTLLLLNNIKFLCNDFLILVEKDEIHSRISELHYEYFEDINDVYLKLESQKDDIQIVIDNNEIKYGSGQNPSLWNYPDDKDIIKFLLN